MRNSLRCPRPLQICEDAKLPKMDNPMGDGGLRYLQRCPQENDTAATWQNPFERAGDATSASLIGRELQAVKATEASCPIVITAVFWLLPTF